MKDDAESLENLPQGATLVLPQIFFIIPGKSLYLYTVDFEIPNATTCQIKGHQHTGPTRFSQLTFTYVILVTPQDNIRPTP